MKTPARDRPVGKALAGYDALSESQKSSGPLPSERELASRWGVSASAVNRAAQRLIATGRLRREGYRLFHVPGETSKIAGARIAVVTHRADSFPGLSLEAAARGVHVEELYYIGRDTMRAKLHLAAERRFDGVIASLSDTGWEWDAEAKHFDDLRIPCVFCGEAPASRSVVAEDIRNGAEQAVSHLAEAGHRDIVLLASLRRGHRADAVRRAYQEACRRLSLRHSASQVAEFTAHNPDSMRAGLQRIRREFPQATAVVLFDITALAYFLTAAKGMRIAIPGGLSLVAMGDSPAARGASPAVTAVAFDGRLMGRLALDLVCQQALEARRAGRLGGPQRLRLESRLIERSSVAPLPRSQTSAAKGSPPFSGREFRQWPEDRDLRLREAADTWAAPHRLLAKGPPGKFASLNLGPFANRSLTREHGWLGDLPLLHVVPGLRQVHGVPFRVIDERANRGKAAVVLRSHRAPPSSAPALPLEVTLPVGHRVRAVYFLHGCGFAGEPAPFAWYDFDLSGRRSVSVPIASRGLRRPVAGAPQPNIQDWWADFPQFTAPGVKHAVISHEGDPYEYERYLYTLEWVNPSPGATLKTICLRSNPSSATTLGVLAITLLIGR